MGEEMETKYVKDVEVTVSKIGFDMNPNTENDILKITFETTNGNITWKPKREKITHLHGAIEKREKVCMDLFNLPEMISKMGMELSKHGSFKAKINYTVMKTEVDGESKIYRFITSEKTFNQWSLIDSSVEEFVSDELE